jgi:hypothetical protein
MMRRQVLHQYNIASLMHNKIIIKSYYTEKKLRLLHLSYSVCCDYLDVLVHRGSTLRTRRHSHHKC